EADGLARLGAVDVVDKNDVDLLRHARIPICEQSAWAANSPEPFLRLSFRIPIASRNGDRIVSYAAYVRIASGLIAREHEIEPEERQRRRMLGEAVALLEHQRREVTGRDDGDVLGGLAELADHPRDEPLDLRGDTEDHSRLQRLDGVLGDHRPRTGQL